MVGDHSIQGPYFIGGDHSFAHHLYIGFQQEEAWIFARLSRPLAPIVNDMPLNQTYVYVY